MATRNLGIPALPKGWVVRPDLLAEHRWVVEENGRVLDGRWSAVAALECAHEIIENRRRYRS